MNRFFDCVNRVVIDSDGLVDKLAGDEVVPLCLDKLGVTGSSPVPPMKIPAQDSVDCGVTHHR